MSFRVGGPGDVRITVCEIRTKGRRIDRPNSLFDLSVRSEYFLITAQI